MTQEVWLTKRELAARLKVSERTIERLGLPAMRVGGQNRYQMSEVTAHLAGEQRRAQIVALPVGERSAA